MRIAQLQLIADEIIAAVKLHVAGAVAGVVKQVGELSARVDDLARFQAIPGPRGEKGDRGDPGLKGDPGESIVGPKGDSGESIRGAKGDHGTAAEIDYGRVGELVTATVANAVAALPAPVPGAKGDPGDPGKAAEIDYGRVAGLVTATVATAVAALPVPAPGKDADPETVRELVDAEVVKAVAALPKPRDGKSIDQDEIAAMVRSTVSTAVSELPPAPKGKDADPVDVAAIVAEVLAKIPAPIPGKDADPELVKAEVVRAVAALPTPAPGKDADPEAVRSLVAAEVVKAVAALPPAKQGEPGKAGDNGKNVEPEMVRLVAAEILPGMVERAQSVLAERMEEAIAKMPAPAPGKDGTNIHPDTVALMVRDAVDKAVAALPVAKNGEPGRDAAQLIVLPGIDETRSYPAGTYAKHAGGEIRAERLTDPVKDGDIRAAGWTVSRDGLVGVTIKQGDDPREIAVTPVLTSGTQATVRFTVPMMLDKGVWREGEYQQGDHVSWDGSGWIAQRKTTAKPGDEFDKKEKDWRLAVKRGRDGKDATPPPPAAGPVRLK